MDPTLAPRPGPPRLESSPHNAMASHSPVLPSLLIALLASTGLAPAARASSVPTPVPYHTPAITGTVLRYPDFPSAKVAPRDVFVWLPPSYATHPARRYPVLYMHDGQCLFDPTASLSHAEWGIYESMTRLIAAGKVREAIVVGIANTGHRAEEYIPRKALDRVLGTGSAADHELHREAAMLGFRADAFHSMSDAYLAFIVTELKPFIDRTYRSLPDRSDTMVAGSSLGGLISLYAICEYPKVFGSAACISTHWTVGDGMMIGYLRRHGLPNPRTHRIYFDYGTRTLDRDYGKYQVRVDALMRAAGYTDGLNWVTREFPGADHSERSWHDRAPVYLDFLLGTPVR